MVRPGSPRVLRYPAGETVEPDGETYPSALADGLWTAAFASAVREAHLRHAVEGCAGRRSTPTASGARARAACVASARMRSASRRTARRSSTSGLPSTKTALTSEPRAAYTRFATG